MTATDSISKEALIQAIHEMPAEKLTFPSLFEHLMHFFKVEDWGVKLPKATKKTPAKSKAKKFDYEAYRKKILQTSTWSDEDIAPILEARQSLNNRQIQEW